MLNNRKITCLLSSALIYAVAGLSTQAFAASINEVMQEGENRADAGEAAQKKVDSVADQTEKITVYLFTAMYLHSVSGPPRILAELSVLSQMLSHIQNHFMRHSPRVGRQILML